MTKEERIYRLARRVAAALKQADIFSFWDAYGRGVAGMKAAAEDAEKLLSAKDPALLDAITEYAESEPDAILAAVLAALAADVRGHYVR